MQRYLVLDIGGTFIKYALMGQDGTILEQGKVPSPQESMDALLAAIAPIGAKFAGQYAGTAVSMPGRTTPPAGLPIRAASLPLSRTRPWPACWRTACTRR